MTRNRGMGLMIGALVFMALVGPGYAADATIQANAAIQGEGRFYRATENMILFSGFFQGAINVTNQQGDLSVNAASLTCPGNVDVNTDHQDDRRRRPLPLPDAGWHARLCALDVHRQSG